MQTRAFCVFRLIWGIFNFHAGFRLLGGYAIHRLKQFGLFLYRIGFYRMTGDFN